MKKLIVCSSVAVLMLSTLNVYAGPKFKKIKNPKLGARVTGITAEMLRMGKLRYIPRTVERIATPAQAHVDASAVHAQPINRAASQGLGDIGKSSSGSLNRTVTHEVNQAIQASRLDVAQHTSFTWKEVYTDPAELSRDVARFYDGKGGEPYIGIMGEELVLYEVPEGIVYHPATRLFPKELDPQNEFILYNPARQRGQIIKKDMLPLFKKAKDVDRNTLTTGEELFSKKSEEGTIAPEKATDAQAAQASPSPEPATAKNFIGQEVYRGQADLARDVALFYEGEGGTRVQDLFGRDFVLYELPEDGIVYHPYGKADPEILTRDKYVIVYNLNNNAGQLVGKNSPAMEFYKPVEDLSEF